jgi:membrane-associated phospholipid phosphatase
MTLMPNASEAPAPSPAEPTVRLGARVILAAASLVLVAVPFALLLELIEDRWPPLLRADRGARDGLYAFAETHPGFVTAMQLISDLGSTPLWIAVFAVVVGWLFWRRLPWLALFVLVTVVGSSLLNALVKTAVHRVRPVLSHPVAHAHGLSFPSGHAQSAIVGYAVLLLVFLPILYGAFRRSAVTFAAVMVLAIGFSRIALGVHYVSDVVGGFVLGAAWVAAMAAAFNVVGVNRERRVDSASHRSGLGGDSFGGTPGR